MHWVGGGSKHVLQQRQSWPPWPRCLQVGSTSSPSSPGTHRLLQSHGMGAFLAPTLFVSLKRCGLARPRLTRNS
eukprot:2997873-Prymnesium_polylepis.1